jgi:antitoxin ParD1/3/4
MNVSLTPELERYVQEKVSTGMYYSASEVIREGLRLLQERDRMQEIQMQQLKQEIQTGLDSGETTPLNMKEVKTQARRSRKSGKP